MEKNRHGVYIEDDLWKKFLTTMVKVKGKTAISECVSEAIKLWLRKH